MKVFLQGRDGVGWSIDRDRECSGRALAASGHRIARTPVFADAVYCVWWNMLASPRWRPLRFKRVAAVVTNDLAHQEDLFRKVRPLVDVWVPANSGQRRFLLDHGVPDEAIRQCPFYVEEEVFRPAAEPREEIARTNGVDYEQIRDRYVIGSFQRDSLGEDVRRPKWQKDPQLLLDVLERLVPDGAILLLAGPRRHFVLEECRRRSIPYVFVGLEPPPGSAHDDIGVNTLPLRRIAALWNLVDTYVVPSKSEGGPKALIEAGLTDTGIVSTPVGMAPDLLPDRLLFRTADEAAELVRRQMRAEAAPEMAEFLARIREVNAFDAYRQRVDSVVTALASGVSARRAPA